MTGHAIKILAIIVLLDAMAAAAEYSPYAGQAAPTRVYWGDTHLHTSVSTDAAARGNRLGLEAAYRFARGQEVTSSTGVKARLGRPLDFLVIADHSDGMGFFGLMASGHLDIMKEKEGQRWHDLLQQGEGGTVAREVIGGFAQGTLPWKTNDPKLMAPVWNANIEAAERFNDPGNFTAFIGYEWTSLVNGNNLHRVVIYRDGASRTSQVLPYTLGDSPDPEDLWAYLASYEANTGGKVLAIPHNANLSNGMMFADVTMSGQPLSSDYARRRSQWEPLTEVSQIKGDGESHPFLSPNDEFADFETWDSGNLDLSQAKTRAMLKSEYAREALKSGLAFDRTLGANPFQFGMIASTDSHTSLAAVEENNFFGKHSGTEPAAERASHVHRKGKAAQMLGWEQVSSGYAAVWARENSREALWDAMKRREVYGTTGPRITVRLFAGWDFAATDASAPDPAAIGYARGVPMGGTLTAATAGQSPTLLVAASRDPQGANLDRIQIIKGWVDDTGVAQEKIFNVAWSDGRTLHEDGSLPAVGSTVDIASATWLNSIGSAELSAVWRDPQFKPDQQAFYYARVLEIPTPRWTAYDALRLGATIPADTPMTGQERAYTSPVWYQP